MTDAELKEWAKKADFGVSVNRMQIAFDAVHLTAANLSVWERDEPGAPRALCTYAESNRLMVWHRTLEDGQRVMFVERGRLRHSIDVYLEKTAPSTTGK